MVEQRYLIAWATQGGDGQLQPKTPFITKVIPAAIACFMALCLANSVLAEISVQQLLSENPSRRQTVMKQLAMLPVPEKKNYIPELVRLLQDKEAYRVIPAFAKIGPSAVPALTRLLDDPNRGLRGFAATAIATIRPVAPENINKLHMMLKDKDEWVRRRVAQSLLSLGILDKEAQSIIREMWKPASPPVLKMDGTVYKNSVPDQAAVPGLIKALKDKNPETRIDAVQTLEMMHLFGSDVETACIQALQDPSSRVREHARSILFYQASEAAMDALLQDEIEEIARKKEIERRAQMDNMRPHSQAEILAPIPADPDNVHPLEVADQFETKSPDGTVVYVVLHKGKGRCDLLRIWRFQRGSYYLVKEYKAAESYIYLSAGEFRYHGKAYLHVMRLWDGTGYNHEDDFFRIESGGLTPLTTPKGLPIMLAPGEGVWKGAFQTFEDDQLEFQFGIWKEGDANCCPTAGSVRGTYTIVGNELKYMTWNRTNDPPRSNMIGRVTGKLRPPSDPRITSANRT
jgi:HEAT repeat protein